LLTHLLVIPNCRKGIKHRFIHSHLQPASPKASRFARYGYQTSENGNRHVKRIVAAIRWVITLDRVCACESARTQTIHAFPLLQPGIVLIKNSGHTSSEPHHRHQAVTHNGTCSPPYWTSLQPSLANEWDSDVHMHHPSSIYPGTWQIPMPQRTPARALGQG
jgi:hypothetical protein